MPEQMMRIAGRGDDGLAKALRSNDLGDLQIGLNSMQMQKEVLASGVTIGAGRTVNVISAKTDIGVNYMSLGVSGTSGTEISIIVAPIVEGAVVNEKSRRIVDREVIKGSRLLSNKFEVPTDSYRITIVNHSDEDVVITLVAYKTSAHAPRNEKAVPDAITIAKEISIAPMTSQTVVDNYSIEDAVAFSLGVISHTGAQSISVNILPIIEGGILSHINYGYEPVLINRPMNTQRILTKKYLLKTPRFGISIINHSSTEANIDIVLFKSKNTEGCYDFMNDKELFGTTIHERPYSHAVGLGVVYMATSSGEIWMNTVDGWLKQ